MISALPVRAQLNTDVLGGRNIMKMNLMSWLGSTYSVEYERQIAGSFSMNTTVSHVPAKKLPFQSLVEKIVDDKALLGKSSLGAFSAAQEFRFYLGKGGLTGFYIAPFVKYGRHHIRADIPANTLSAGVQPKAVALVRQTALLATISPVAIMAQPEPEPEPEPEPKPTVENILVKGSVNAYTAGISFGAQWNLGKFVYLDWRIAGPSYGVSRGALRGNAALTAAQQEIVKQNLQNLTKDIPVIKAEHTVSENGVSSTLDGPWAGIRTGLSLGYRF